MKNVVRILVPLLLPLHFVFAQSFEGFMRGQPVIDVHLHLTRGFEDNKSYNPDGLKRGAALDSLRMRWALNDLDRNQVVLALAGGPAKYAAEYAEADPRLWTGIQFPCSNMVETQWPCETRFHTYEELKALYKEHPLRAMGETMFNYHGISPTDPRADAYWKLAEELQLPIGVHSDSGPPQVNEKEYPNYSPHLANPAQLRPVLEKYPGLKIFLMHYGNDYTDEAIALMKEYPQIYCDISAVSMFLPKEVWEPKLKKLYDAGLGDRVMFGSDYIGTIEKNLRIIFGISFLSEEQKRDILYFNAARFLGLSEEEKIRHHREVIN